jgi:hypothetical protein
MSQFEIVLFRAISSQTYSNHDIHLMDNGKEACPDFGPFIILTNAILNN